jgi:hypothetical protein
MGRVLGYAGLIHRDAGAGEMPEEVLEIIGGILVVQKLDQGGDPETRVADELAANGADVLIAKVEKVGSEKGAEIGDCLFGGREITFREGAEHLVRMELLVELTLTGSVILVTREEGLCFARHGGCGRLGDRQKQQLQ